MKASTCTTELEAAWVAVESAVGFLEITDERQYDHAMALIEAMIDEVRGADRHPLHAGIRWLAQEIESWESCAHPVSGPVAVRATR